MSALICWILIVECVMEIKIVHGNDRVIITVPVHIRKLHHTKTIYKIIEKPVYKLPDVQQPDQPKTLSATPAVLGEPAAMTALYGVEPNNTDGGSAKHPHDFSVGNNETSYWHGEKSTEGDDDDDDGGVDGRNVRNVGPGYGIRPATAMAGYGYKTMEPDDDIEDEVEARREDTGHGRGYGHFDRGYGPPDRGLTYMVRKYPRPPAPVVELGSESRRQVRGPHTGRIGDRIWHVREPMHGHFAGGDLWRDHHQKQQLKQQQQYAVALKPPGRFGAGWHSAAAAPATVVPVLLHDGSQQYKYRKLPVAIGPQNGYRVRENVAEFDDPFPITVPSPPPPPPPRANAFPAAAGDHNYSRPEGVMSVSAVDSPQIVRNVYYTLDPVVPYHERSKPFPPNRRIL
ncbi:Hypothetical protein CINCED_3A016645 [Cinara cedri]|uniref:Uncharacterized protein n=1 Tax=Cinara cedri TaxID=506608 RepID=A0A5E4NQ93_9HEMI|nr:Hypothetical protein CINCED_3A016645 [Cinara cedri]